MENQTELKVEYIDIEKIIPYDKNPRNNSPAVEACAASIRDYGFGQPISVDENMVIISGHTRRLAALKIGMKQIPCIVRRDLTPEQVRAYRVVDNKIAELSEWNEELLAQEIAALPEFNFADYGFDLGALATDMADADTSEDDFDVDAEPEELRVRRGEVWKLGEHRLMCGDSTSAADIDRLMGGAMADLWLTDPPYNVNYGADPVEGEERTIMNDNMGDEAFRKFLTKAFTLAAAKMKPGAAFYICHADSEGWNFRTACREANLKVRQCLVWRKDSLVLGRQDYQWIHEPCQPAGTMVRTPNGEVPIEALRDGDRVVAYDTLSGVLKGLRDGCEIKTASRMYDGMMYSVSICGKTTRTTDNHRFSVRFNPNARKNYCTYLMRRGDWWRVGHTRAYDARQFGIKSRCHQENADEGWLIECFETRADAQLAEQRLAIEFGIPYTHWETGRGMTVIRDTFRTTGQIERFYDSLDKAKLERNAHRLLAAFGRSAKFPFYAKGRSGAKLSTRVTCRIEACNLMPGLMQLPMPRAGYGCDDGRLFDWNDIESVTHKKFKGRVFSLAVKRWGHYIADGIITHNCLYGWKDGAAHKWNSDRKQTTVLEFDRPKKSELHPTMKPIALMAYLMSNSSDKGDAVLETFGGSGTTLIAAERLGRRCFCMELDERYATVILNRWEEETGQAGERIEAAPGEGAAQ